MNRMEVDETDGIYTCTSRCEKGIYETGEFNSNWGAIKMDNYFNDNISIGNTFSVRENQLENIFNKKTPSISELFQDIDKQEILGKISKFELSENVKHFVMEYEKAFSDRESFLWRFLGTVFKETGVTLSTVDEKYFDSTIDNKIILTILVAILDDVADIHKDGDLLAKISEVLKNDDIIIKNKSDEKIILVKKLWDHITNELSKYPRYDEYKDVFNYDFNQLLNAMNYSYLVNKNPLMINIHEMENYDSHNMIVFLYNGIDLMASTKLDTEELPYLRSAFWHAQKMARIGNWLSTWKREIKENDISSGVFAYAISSKILTIQDIEKLSHEEIVSRIEKSDTYEYFFKEWTQNHKKLESLKDSVKSVNMNQYISGLENVIKYHLASEGLK